VEWQRDWEVPEASLGELLANRYSRSEWHLER
jgi:hypothetical protein